MERNVRQVICVIGQVPSVPNFLGRPPGTAPAANTGSDEEIRVWKIAIVDVILDDLAPFGIVLVGRVGGGAEIVFPVEVRFVAELKPEDRISEILAGKFAED